MASKPLLVFLLFVFGIHLVIFLVLAIRQRKNYHVLAVITFVLLLTATGIRLWRPQLHLGPYSAYVLLKYTAWTTTAAMAIAYLRHRCIK